MRRGIGQLGALAVFALLAVGASLAAPERGAAQVAAASPFKRLVRSSFSQNDEGWRVLPKTFGGPLRAPSYSGVAENISFNADDAESRDYFSWVAPEKFTGDLAEAWRGYLEFELGASSTAMSFPTKEDVVILGGPPDREPVRLYYDLPTIPETGLTRFQVPLDEEEGWKVVGTDAQPTRKQFVCVLAHVKTLVIRGRFVDASPYASTLDSPAIYRFKKSRPIADVTPKAGSTTDFILVPIGQSAEEQVLIENTGTAPLSVEFANLSGYFGVRAESPDFCGYVAPGESELLTVRYTPEDIGRHKAKLFIKTNDPRQKSVVLKFKGRGSDAPGADLKVTPDPIDFGTAQNDTRPQVRYTIRNDGKRGYDFEVTAAPNPPFSAGSVPFRWSLAPGEEVSNFLSFGDKGNGDFNGEMIVKDTKTGNTLVTVPLQAKRENSLCARLGNCQK